MDTPQRSLSNATITRRALAALVLPIACAALSGQATSIAAPRADHHQHVMSPALAKAWSQPEAVTAERVIAQLDAAGIRRAVVLSVAYAWGSPTLATGDDAEYARVRDENDWAAKEVAPYRERLRGFCSLNPLKTYALAELDRCSRHPVLRAGLKLHFANSGVNLGDAAHVEQVRRVFARANQRRLPIVAHIWTGDNRVGVPFGRRDARTFLDRVLPSAPDIPIQIAHLGGSGPRLDAGTSDAISALAEAVAAREPITRNVYFDVATSAMRRWTSAENAAFLVARLRQIGVSRILYGSDMALGGNPTAAEGWSEFQKLLPLTPAELNAIAGNVAPYVN